MKTVVFLGPTLPRAEAEAIAPHAEFWPPAQAGDIYRAVQHEGATVIGLIDGIFGTAPSAWHKEILFAMAKGVRVLGSSSMGALRGAECETFGMEGVGAIYEMYSTGELAADDEVAVSHLDGTDGFRSLTMPLVQIRAFIRLAIERGAMCASEAEQVLGACQQTFYADRTPRVVTDILVDRVGEHRAPDLLKLAQSPEADVKALDAHQLLHRLDKGNCEPIRAEFVFEASAFWKRLRSEVDFPRVTPWFEDPTHPMDLSRRVDILRGALLEPNDQSIGRDSRLWALLVERECERLAIEVTPSDFKRKASDFRRQRRLGDATAMHRWLSDVGLTVKEWQQAMVFLVQVDKLAEQHGSQLRQRIPLLIALNDGWCSFDHLEGSVGETIIDPSFEEIAFELDGRGLPSAPDLETLASILSFTSVSELLEALERRSRKSNQPNGSVEEPVRS